MIKKFFDFQGQVKQKNPKQLKIIAVSDTHGSYYTLQRLKDQQGDIFIHAGDFSYYGQTQDFDNFMNFLDNLKFKHKIVISGNHQIVLDNGNIQPNLKNQYFKEYPCKYSRQFIISQIKKRAIYLEHQYVEIQGLKIFSSPYTQYYCGSAFQVKPEVLDFLWKQIPPNLDILITHGPPFGILDKTRKKINSGCKILQKTVRKVAPKIHIFGHIHEAHGFLEQFGTRFYNVAEKPQIIKFQ